MSVLRRLAAAVGFSGGSSAATKTGTVSAAARLDGALAELEGMRSGAALDRAARAEQGVAASSSDSAAPTSQSDDGLLASFRAKRAAAAAAAAAASSPLAKLVPYLSAPMTSLKDAPITGRELATLAQACFEGDARAGIAKDEVKASQLWYLASVKGDLQSVYIVASASVDGFGRIPRDRARAHAMLEKLAATKQPWVSYSLGALLIQEAVEAAAGSGAVLTSAAVAPARIPPAARDTPALRRAYHLVLEAAQAGSVPPAWMAAANCLSLGIGTPVDEAAALRWWQHAASRGDALAAVQAAASMDRAAARGVVIAQGDSLAYWRLGAQAGHPLAMHNVGVAYLEAKPTPDSAAALVWFRRAADAGFARSALNAGAVLERGAADVTRDVPEALRFYRRALSLASSELDAVRGSSSGASASASVAVAMLEQLVRVAARRVARCEAAAGGDSSTLSPPPAVNDDGDADEVAELHFATVEERDAALAAVNESLQRLTGSNPNATNASLPTILQLLRGEQASLLTSPPRASASRAAADATPSNTTSAGGTSSLA